MLCPAAIKSAVCELCVNVNCQSVPVVLLPLLRDGPGLLLTQAGPVSIRKRKTRCQCDCHLTNQRAYDDTAVESSRREEAGGGGVLNPSKVTAQEQDRYN